MSAGMDLQTEAPPGCGTGSVYSHRNKRAERTAQSAVTPNMTQIGISMLSVPMPKNVFFIIVSPCVSGKKPPRFCVKSGCQFVKKYKLRLRNQCQHDKKALPFTVRKTFYRNFCFVANAELLAKCVPIGGIAVEACGFLTKFGNLDLLLIVALLKLHADALKKRTAFLLWVLPKQANSSAVCLFCAEHTFDRSAFSGTVCAEQTEYRTAFYR